MTQQVPAFTEDGITLGGFDKRRFRQCAGRFATGVTIITARGPDGRPVGVTANSFSSVSLDPPLILWSLALSARSFNAFRSAQGYAINILSAAQLDLASRFARSDQDKFAGVDWREGAFGAPVIGGASATLECRAFAQHEGGDHLIFIGEVIAIDHDASEQLLFMDGEFSRRSAHPSLARSTGERREAEIGEDDLRYDFIVPLLVRAKEAVTEPFYAEIKATGVSVAEMRLLACLAPRDTATPAEIAARIFVDAATIDAQILRMTKEGLLASTERSAVAITETGRQKLQLLNAIARRYEARLFAGLDPERIAVLKDALRLFDGAISATPISATE
ncbi:NADH-FMN oxidoreductase RutF, flavin reductase (DIM6/NTAB) family [Rhizobiales bacterium GAS191]|nr:NADH-FMN oxidoreductase RutF, flavin reductase (DIM6/NTAB) family [Rhizobiales bacterium GAS191]